MGTTTAGQNFTENTTSSGICENILREKNRASGPHLAVNGNGNGNYSNETILLPGPAYNADWFSIVIPIICFLGVIGNILNIVVLTRKRLLTTMDRLERTANFGLVALALSDMLFCLAVFPHAFLTEEKRVVHNEEIYKLYYKIYGIGLINLFFMISTWLIVSMALSRLIVVVYPFRAREILGMNKSVGISVAVYVVCTILTIPQFVHFSVKECFAYDGRILYEIKPTFSKQTDSILKIYGRWVWPIIADFIPLGVLVFCNARLIQELRRAVLTRRASAPGQVVRESNHKVTLTLIIIVLMLFILVSPAEILKYINPYRAWGRMGFIVASIANVLQATNFAFNFVLYCVVNAHFRYTIKGMLMVCFRRREGRAQMLGRPDLLEPSTNTYRLDTEL